MAFGRQGRYTGSCYGAALPEAHELEPRAGAGNGKHSIISYPRERDRYDTEGRAGCNHRFYSLIADVGFSCTGRRRATIVQPNYKPKADVRIGMR